MTSAHHLPLGTPQNVVTVSCLWYLLHNCMSNGSHHWLFVLCFPLSPLKLRIHRRRWIPSKDSPHSCNERRCATLKCNFLQPSHITIGNSQAPYAFDARWDDTWKKNTCKGYEGFRWLVAGLQTTWHVQRDRKMSFFNPAQWSWKNRSNLAKPGSAFGEALVSLSAYVGCRLTDVISPPTLLKLHLWFTARTNEKANFLVYNPQLSQKHAN